MGYLLTIELTAVAGQVAGYSDNIGNKLAALEKKYAAMDPTYHRNFSIACRAPIRLPANRT